MTEVIIETLSIMRHNSHAVMESFIYGQARPLPPQDLLPPEHHQVLREGQGGERGVQADQGRRGGLRELLPLLGVHGERGEEGVAAGQVHVPLRVSGLHLQPPHHQENAQLPR